MQDPANRPLCCAAPQHCSRVVGYASLGTVCKSARWSMFAELTCSIGVRLGFGDAVGETIAVQTLWHPLCVANVEEESEEYELGDWKVLSRTAQNFSLMSHIAAVQPVATVDCVVDAANASDILGAGDGLLGGSHPISREEMDRMLSSARVESSSSRRPLCTTFRMMKLVECSIFGADTHQITVFAGVVE